jgi:hypothetical protein
VYEQASRAYAVHACELVEDRASFSNEVDLMEALETVVQLDCRPGLAAPFTMPSDTANRNVGPSFSWHFITALCTEGEDKQRTDLLAAMMDMLKVHNTSSRLLCLLHMFQELLHSCSPFSADLLRRLLPTLELFYFWPSPHGPLAQTLSVLVERELSSPGAALRERYLAEAPHIAAACESGQDQEHMFRIPVILDATSSNTEYFKRVVADDVVHSRRPSARDCMVWLIADMVRCCCPEPLSDEAVWGLKEQPLTEISELYEVGRSWCVLCVLPRISDSSGLLHWQEVNHIDMQAQRTNEHETSSFAARVAVSDYV